MDQFDVELVEAPDTAPKGKFCLTKREYLVAGAGAGVMLLLFGFVQVILWIVRYFRG